MVRAGVGEAVEAAIDMSIAARTRQRYASARRRYEAWCGGLDEEPLPVTEEKAVAYVAVLARDGLKDTTIKHHLAALRMAHIKAGLPAPDWGAMCRLAQLRKGLVRMEVVGGKDALVREPVEWRHLVAMRDAWRNKGLKGKMLWAAACMCFFGCLRAGEALAPESGEFDEKAHLSWEDVMLEGVESPRWIKVRIKESKTDRLRVGASVTLHRTGMEVCPVRAVLEYMACRRTGAGPFFVSQKGEGLTRRQFVAEVRAALEESSIPATGISGHSFRIGAATSASRGGATDEEVKALGRWASREYRGYIRLEGGAQAAAAKKWTETVSQGGGGST